MNDDECNIANVSKEYLTVSIEPDIHFSNNEQIYFFLISMVYDRI
jgi:hypothetical protein